uniref:Uncharacterized protein n=1 Tax=Lotharella oceanica TaxID=641309 RepID=A0A7S2TIZ3_9EUKA|mmetsp:Transcript_15941/g.30232  ORF Transcript_15941/g.30232 Transcript_15941/m.30232 type:complete len:164 (+) Transcript_15941:586-1077(+)
MPGVFCWKHSLPASLLLLLGHFELPWEMLVRSLCAVLAGYVAMAVSTIAMFVVLGAVIPGAFESYATGKAQPSNGVLLVILTFGVLSAVLGGYVTASLAKSSPMDHVYALAGFVVVLGLWSAFYEGESAPLWYRLALAVIGGAGVVVGGTMTVTEPPEYARLD